LRLEPNRPWCLRVERRFTPYQHGRQFLIVKGLRDEPVHAGRDGLFDALVVVVGAHAQDEQGLVAGRQVGLLEGAVPTDTLEPVHDGNLRSGTRSGSAGGREVSIKQNYNED
jgi:hypothetical protein